MNPQAKNPIPVEQEHTYAHTANARLIATAVQITGDINSILLKGGVPPWFKTAVEAGAIQESLSGQITLTLPKGATTFDLCPQAGEWLVKTNAHTDTNGFDVLTDESFRYLYKRIPVAGDWVFALGGTKGTALIEHVTNVAYADKRTPIAIRTHARLPTSPIRGLWRFAETKEIQAQAHEDSIAYKQFWGIEDTAPMGFTQNADGSYTSDGSGLSRKELIDVIRAQHIEKQNFHHFIKQLRY